MDSKIEQLILNNLSKLKEITSKLSKYNNNEITLNKVVYFLLQFHDYGKIEIMLRLLTHIELFDSSRLVALVMKALKQIEPELLVGAVYCALGSTQDSCAIIGYALGKELFDDEKIALEKMGDINSLGEKLEKKDVKAVVFYDDNITSGSQLDDFFAELTTGRVPREMVQQPLTPTQIKRLRHIPIRICYAVQLSSVATARVSAIADKYQLDLKIYCGKHDLDNQIEFGSGVLQSKTEEIFTIEFLKEIARPLYADKVDWSDEKKENRLLGFGNLGKLTAFYYNIPKALLPVFWKSGIVDGKPWIPLLPEYKERKRMQDNHIKPDKTLEWIVQVLLEKDPQSRTPALNFSFQVKDEMVDEIEIEIPSARWLKTEIFEKYLPERLEYDRQYVADEAVADFYSKVTLPGMPASTNSFSNYRNAVNDYNQAFEKYCELIQHFVFWYTSKLYLRIMVQNTGTASASHLLLQTKVNSSTVLIDRFDTVIRPKFGLAIPKWADYKSYHGKAQPLTIVSNFESFVNFNEKKPCIWNHIYQETLFESDLVLHKDISGSNVELVRTNITAQSVKLPCILKYKEMTDTIEKDLVIHYQETDTVDEELKQNIIAYYRSFFPGIPFKPR
jgi:hypothetical protein